MNKVYSFWLEGPPPIQRRMRGRRHYKPKENIQDEDRVREIFLGNYPLLSERTKEQRYSLEIKIYTRKVCDGDNVEKAVMDALTKTLWLNDRQVRQGFWTFMDHQPEHEEGIGVRILEL